MAIHPVEAIFHPRSIAVVGASGNPSSWGYGFLAPLLEFGYQGKIYPVNLKHSEVLGIKAYPSLGEIPDPVDYVISCIPASEVLKMLEDCSPKGVKTVHLFTARFSETGHQQAAELEQEILREAKKRGIRLIGPNCMGLYYPREGISFSDALSKQSGTVGFISQSGQAAEELVRLAAPRGVYFSKVISYGNALDLNECDFLDYFSQDEKTNMILMYVEGIRNGQRFIDSLGQAASAKPVIILKGGRGESGGRAVASHTASLAGSQMIWEALITQAGALSAENLDELVDVAAAFSFLPPINGRKVGITGGGGGASVLAADQCEEAGLDVIPLPMEIREELRIRGITIWDWIGNPADMSIREDPNFCPGDMLEVMAKNKNFDFLMAIMYEPHHKRQQGMSADAYLEQYKLAGGCPKPLLAVAAEKGLGIEDFDHWSWKIMCEVRTKLLAAHIPFYPTIKRAAKAAKKLIDYYQQESSKPLSPL